MFLFSPILLKEFKFAINFTSFFSALPFKWNNTTGLIDYVQQLHQHQSYFGSWNFIKYVFLLHEGYIVLRYLQSIAELKLDKFGLFAVETMGLIFISLAAFLQIFVMMRGRALVKCCNRFLKYFIAIQG